MNPPTEILGNQFVAVVRSSMRADELPLGFAVMSMRGATADLADALNSLNLAAILASKERLAETVSSYRRSREAAPRDSLVTNTLICIGEDSATVAETKLKIAADLLRSSLKLV